MQPGTMATVEVALTGDVGGVDSRGSVQTFDIAAAEDKATRILPGALRQNAAHSAAPPAGWPVFGTSATGNVVRITATYAARAQNATKLDTSMSARHGALKINRGADVSF